MKIVMMTKEAYRNQFSGRSFSITTNSNHFSNNKMLARVVTTRLTVPIMARAFADIPEDKFKQKGAGDERSYFDQQDKAALAALLAKMEKNVKAEKDVAEVHAK